MARGAAQAKRKAAKAQPGRRRQAAARRPPTIEQTMFFPRLRRQAKWVFLALAFVFAGGFVFFGVGSGSTGLGDLLRGNFNIFGSNGGSTNSSAVKSALKKTHAHPKDPNAATAEETTALQKDTQLYKRLAKLEPTDVNTQFHYAQLADLIGDAKSAITAYKKVVRLAPSDPSAQQARQRIAILSAATPVVKHR